MIRHSPSCMTVTHMASWPTTQRMLIPELKQAQGTLIRKTTTARGLTPHEIALIRPLAHFRSDKTHPPEPSQSLFTHRPARGARGFLHWRLSYASARNPSQLSSFLRVRLNVWFWQKSTFGRVDADVCRLGFTNHPGDKKRQRRTKTTQEIGAAAFRPPPLW
jgi:hypothetical protein